MVTLRPATEADVSLLEHWDQQPHVIRATTDNPNAQTAFEDVDWLKELASQDAYNQFLIAEASGRAIGVMQIIDPHHEPTHYWGEIETGLCALDIWIGEADALGKGYGTQMMAQAIAMCFADQAVTAIVIDPLTTNTDAHRFYQRLGFKPIERRTFDEDDCLVHRLDRADWNRN